MGRCYELNARKVAFEGMEGDLVQGSIQGFGNPRIGHAWVELDDGRVYDAVLDRYFTQEAWVAFASPVEDARFSRTEAMIQAAKTGHWGPW